MAPKDGSSPKLNLLTLAHRTIFYLSFVYVLFIAILATPFAQEHATFQHALKWPENIDFTIPEKYGYAPGKAANLYIETPDNVTLGTWFILADNYYEEHRGRANIFSQPTLETIQDAIRTQPTIFYLHGAGAARASQKRVRLCASLSARLDSNVFIIDYRGFGDSTGSPTEATITLDAYTAWNWLIEQGAKSEDILVYGHSLGTGVAGQLVTQLAREGVKPRGVALISPFTAAARLVETYDIWGIPVLQPLQSFSWGRNFLKRLLHVKIDTLSIIQDFTVDIFIAHAQDDSKVPHAHSRTLVDRLLDPLLPPSVELPSSPGLAISKEEYDAFTLAHSKRREVRQAIVTKTEIPNFGIIEKFDGSGGEIVYVESFWGDHEEVSVQEGIQDEMAKMFKLGPYRNPQDQLEMPVLGADA